MKEYTMLAAISVVATIVFDRATKTRLLERKDFWFFLGSMFIMKLLVNGFLTGRQIVMYGPEFFLGVRVGSIPVEDFLFGFSMVTMGIILWEYFKRRGL